MNRCFDSEAHTNTYVGRSECDNKETLFCLLGAQFKFCAAPFFSSEMTGDIKKLALNSWKLHVLA